VAVSRRLFRAEQIDTSGTNSVTFQPSFGLAHSHRFTLTGHNCCEKATCADAFPQRKLESVWGGESPENRPPRHDRTSEATGATEIRAEPRRPLRTWVTFTLVSVNHATASRRIETSDGIAVRAEFPMKREVREVGVISRMLG
jgi:hypothetical protein